MTTKTQKRKRHTHEFKAKVLRAAETREQRTIGDQDVRGKLLLPIHWGTWNLAYYAWNEPAVDLAVPPRLATWWR